MTFDKKTILIVSLLAIGGVGFVYALRLGVSDFEVQRLPTIGDPEEFARSFDPAGQKPVELEIGGIEGRVISSPYFPHQSLESKDVASTTHERVVLPASSEHGELITVEGELRLIDADPYWNVFWVEIDDPGSRPKFFGPYKLARPL